MQDCPFSIDVTSFLCINLKKYGVDQAACRQFSDLLFVKRLLVVCVEQFHPPLRLAALVLVILGEEFHANAPGAARKYLTK